MKYVNGVLLLWFIKEKKLFFEGLVKVLSKKKLNWNIYMLYRFGKFGDVIYCGDVVGVIVCFDVYFVLVNN